MTRTPFLNSIGQELGKLLVKENWWYEGLMGIWQGGEREKRLITISALGEVSKRDYENAKKFVLEILKDISHWEICDQLALRVIVKLAVQNQKDTFALLHKWVASENKWIRRLAVATIPPYIRAKKREVEICLGLLEKTMKDGDRDVKKAVAWALREVSKKDRDSVYEFLKKWAEQGDRNTKWIIKEGMKKLGEEQRAHLEKILGGRN